MSSFVSPGVYTRVEDASVYLPRLATTIFGIVTTASKGPTDELTLITDEGSLVGTFGPPAIPHYGLFAAIRYLRQGSQLWVVRVGSYDQDAEMPTLVAEDGISNAVTVSPLTSGSFYNNVSVVVSAGYATDTYKLTILYGTVVVEVFDRVVLGTANEDDVNYIETRINGVSEYISVVDAGTQTDLAAATYTFTGGDDGAPASTTDVIGTVGTPPTVPSTGLQLFADPEVVDVNLLAVPGRWERSVIAAMTALVEARADCFAILDPPDNLSAQSVVDWHNGNLTGDSDYLTTAVNSYQTAVYNQWVKCADGYSASEVWMPPSGHVAQCMAFTDDNAEVWFAPAGWNRGQLPDVVEVRYSPNQGMRDYMYSGGNVVNPIVSFPNRGVVIWGQRTTQRASTSLDRINVARLILNLRKVVATAAQYVLYDPNDFFTWRRFTRLVEPTLDNIKAGRGLENYRVICDQSTNTAVLRNRNEMYARILLVPTKAAEILTISFTLMSSGAVFEDVVATPGTL